MWQTRFARFTRKLVLNMTQDEIIEMARQADVWTEKDFMFADVLNPKIEAFAKLVAEKEREACAKLCEQLSDAKDVRYAGLGSLKCADAIRSKNIIECEPQPAVTEDGFSNWVCPKPIGYLMQCCDCGLIHEAEFRVAKYKDEGSDEFDVVDDVNTQAQFRMRRFEQ
jgi:hypothetical protein